jgi:hypothetical protein
MEKTDVNLSCLNLTCYFLTVIPYVPQEGEDTFPSEQSRRIGIFFSPDEAVGCLNEEITENSTYTLAVVEKLEKSGCYPTLKAVAWLRWDNTEKQWVPTECPSCYAKVINFAIG